jgi:hypothetical protein
MIHWKIILKRIIRRIKYVFYFRELVTWKYESCERCGHCYKLLWSTTDKIWFEVHENMNGCLCLDCFIELAKRKKIELNEDSIKLLEIFNPLDDVP